MRAGGHADGVFVFASSEIPLVDLLINQASPAGQVICFCLLLLSTYSWTVMISKLLFLRRTRKDSMHFLEMFRGQQHPLELYEMGHRFHHAATARVYRSACRELCHYLSHGIKRKGPEVTGIDQDAKISPAHMESVNAVMDRAVGEASMGLEARTAGLATAVSGAPFLGLLGTVWGVMDTFSGLARDPSGASLQSIAPGVASALVTTVVGLLVAIPAMFGYNFIVSRIKASLVSLDNFAAELQSILTRYFVISSAGGRGNSFLITDGEEDDGRWALDPDHRQAPVHGHPATPRGFSVPEASVEDETPSVMESRGPGAAKESITRVHETP